MHHAGILRSFGRWQLMFELHQDAVAAAEQRFASIVGFAGFASWCEGVREQKEWRRRQDKALVCLKRWLHTGAATAFEGWNAHTKQQAAMKRAASKVVARWR
jgi:hypothetical protein